MIANPVLRGFYADPSLIRVGDTYCCANSTFEWWPGVTLHESKDLVHWTPLPSPLNRVSQLDMRGNPPSGGIWAPDLSYADGMFWLVYTDVKGVAGPYTDVVNYLVTARDIRGPWSEPTMLDGVGFDASLFHDVDGRKYLLQQTGDMREYRHSFNGITLTEFDTATMKLKPETMRTIWQGTDVRLVEGPHLYRIDGWYYLFCAEGGTIWQHQESVARSRNIDGPYETMPGNPFLSNYGTPGSYLQKQGHGALFDTPNGEWYYASLCGRPWHHPGEPIHEVRGYCTLGRETSIQKVTWCRDGWPRIDGGVGGRRYVPQQGESMSKVQSVADDTDERALAARAVVDVPDHSMHDDFESPQLEIGWNTQRVPFDAKMGHVGNGALTLIGQGSLCDEFDLSLVARRWRAFEFDATTCVRFDPRHYSQMAGLTNYYSTMFWSWVYVTWDETRQTRVIEVAQRDGGEYSHFLRDAAPEVPVDAECVWLRTIVRTSSYTYEYSFDGERWHELPVVLDAAVLSDDHVVTKYHGFFTGAFVGMACVDMTRFGETATFDFFDYREC